jgi:hypothetical protein
LSIFKKHEQNLPVDLQNKKAAGNPSRIAGCNSGAGGRTRTGTVSPPVDFESTTSANSITPAK